ncbi:MAG: hypothetical protein KA810_13620 [Pyrinomonadaceae bacterium]|nr:hypothetical protein [Pyrinomonadaceae bacterium]
MKTLSIFALIAAFSFTAFAQDTKQNVTALAWISGCWETTGEGRTTIERWGKATDNLMIGTSQTVKGTKSVAFEYLRIMGTATGLTYVALPSNAKEPTAFAAIKITANEVVFENAKHDFPQRIIYRQDKPDSLFARIEGKQDEKEMGMDTPMKRVKCE